MDTDEGFPAILEGELNRAGTKVEVLGFGDEAGKPKDEDGRDTQPQMDNEDGSKPDCDSNDSDQCKG